MTPLQQGLFAGVLFGALSVATMLPLKFPDKRRALLAASIERFAIGLLIPLVHTPVPGWLDGLLLGSLLSLPGAVTTRAAKPMLLTGAVGGLVIGFATRGLH
ncbi:MAG TPA: hypothetical protein VG710_13750 [Opitutus sp.]|nr:hypothetical protein [Opitutus sp.]